MSPRRSDSRSLPPLGSAGSVGAAQPPAKLLTLGVADTEPRIRESPHCVDVGSALGAAELWAASQVPGLANEPMPGGTDEFQFLVVCEPQTEPLLLAPVSHELALGLKRLMPNQDRRHAEEGVVPRKEEAPGIRGGGRREPTGPAHQWRAVVAQSLEPR